jgi:hypothetical protein
MRAVLEGHTGNPNSLVFSPDGTRLATAARQDNTARLWDTAHGELLLSLRHDTGMVDSLAFTPDGTRLATAHHHGGPIRLWDTATGKPLVVLDGTGPMAFSPDGTRLAGMRNRYGIDVCQWLARESPADCEKRRDYWREQQERDLEKRAAAAFEGKQWFAAQFFYNQLIGRSPNHPALEKWQDRRREAEMHLKEAKKPAIP